MLGGYLGEFSPLLQFPEAPLRDTTLWRSNVKTEEATDGDR